MGQVREVRRHHVFTEFKQTAEPAAEAATNDAAHGDLSDGNVKQNHRSYQARDLIRARRWCWLVRGVFFVAMHRQPIIDSPC
jgi:hypothetical protein